MRARRATATDSQQHCELNQVSTRRGRGGARSGGDGAGTTGGDGAAGYARIQRCSGNNGDLRMVGNVKWAGNLVHLTQFQNRMAEEPGASRAIK